MIYVCAELAAQNADSVIQCKMWQLLPEQAPFLPDLTALQAQQIASSVALFLTVCAIYRFLRKSL